METLSNYGNFFNYLYINGGMGKWGGENLIKYKKKR